MELSYPYSVCMGCRLHQISLIQGPTIHCNPGLLWHFSNHPLTSLVSIKQQRAATAGELWRNKHKSRRAGWFFFLLLILKHGFIFTLTFPPLQQQVWRCGNPLNVLQLLLIWLLNWWGLHFSHFSRCWAEPTCTTGPP